MKRLGRVLEILQILQIALPVLYAALVWLFGEIFFRSGDTAPRLERARYGVYSVLAAHVLYIGLYAATYHHDLVTTSYELFSLIAFTLLTTYVLVELRSNRESSGTGFLVSTFAFVFQLSASILNTGSHTEALPPIFRNPIFNVHVTTSVFGYAALSLAMIYGALYLVLYRAMSRNQYGAVFEHLPSLERLERYGVRSTAVGFVFLSISIGLGALLLKDIPATGHSGSVLFDPKILATLLIWVVFGATLLVRKVAKVQGRKIVLFWMYGFLLTIVSMTLVNAFGTTFHNFL